MPRLTIIDPSTATGKARELFDGPAKTLKFNIFKGLANSPAGFEAYLAISGALAKASLNGKEREAIALAVSELNDCDYCRAAHTAIAKQHGLTDEQALDARRGKMSDAKLSALTRFATAMHEKKGFVSDDDIAAVKAAGYNDGHLVEIVATYAATIFTNYFNHLNQTEVDFPAVPAL